MENIKDRVAIIGMGCIRFGELWGKSVEDMLVEACVEAVEDAGVEFKDIQAVWQGNVMDYEYRMSGSSGQVSAHALKLDYIPVTRVENACATATDALRNASFAVAAGEYDIVLVAGVEKVKDVGYAGLPDIKTLPDPSNVQPAVLPASQFALFATRYFQRYGMSYEEGKRVLSKIAVKNHHNGSLDSKAMFQTEISLEKAMSSPMVSWPLGLLDCCGNSDGAAAAIITRADMADRFRDDYVLIKGFGLAVGGSQGILQDDYDFTHMEETVVAANQAYTEAGIKDPKKEIDIASVHDCFTITEVLIYEDLGFSPRGRASQDVEGGTFELDGELPVNTDGGLKSFGHPVGATGLRMMYEIYKQIQGKAGPRQLKKDVDIGLTHNLGGLPGCFSCGICIVGRP